MALFLPTGDLFKVKGNRHAKAAVCVAVTLLSLTVSILSLLCVDFTSLGSKRRSIRYGLGLLWVGHGNILTLIVLMHAWLIGHGVCRGLVTSHEARGDASRRHLVPALHGVRGGRPRAPREGFKKVQKLD